MTRWPIEIFQHDHPLGADTACRPHTPSLYHRYHFSLPHRSYQDAPGIFTHRVTHYLAPHYSVPKYARERSEITSAKTNEGENRGWSDHTHVSLCQSRRIARGRSLRGCVFMLRCYVISCAPLRTARKGSQKRSSGVRNPSCVLRPLTPGTRRARRDGEKVAALSKRRCSRVEDSRGTTLRERHSGVEHAAAPFSRGTAELRLCAPTTVYMGDCACVRVFMCVCARARETSSHSSVVYQTVSPPPRGSRHPFTPLPISRASPFSFFFFFFLIFFYFFLFFLFFFLFLFPLLSSSTSFLISTSSSFFFFFSSSRWRRGKSRPRSDKDAKKRESGYNLWPR